MVLRDTKKNGRDRDGLLSKAELIPIDQLKPYEKNARRHSEKQIGKIAASIQQFGFVNPILVDADQQIIAGHGRWMAAGQLGMTSVPVLRVSHLTPDEVRAYRIADNKIAELADWDDELLALELGELAVIDLNFDLEITGFETGEIDLLLSPADPNDEDENDVPEPPSGPAITRPGDLWHLGSHKLICGDAREAGTYRAPMGSDRADCVFTDPPYNVAITGHVCGKGRIQHREFAMASGKMSRDAFTGFLKDSLSPMTEASRDGAIHFVCMDWRHMPELQAAGAAVYTELKNMIVWVKTNAGMGSFYRSQHELVFVYKCGTAPHMNNFGLGETGRHRSNVWHYAGVNSFGNGREDLALHPTVKPVAMVADAILDVTRRGGIVLDGFGGSGTTLIAAEKTGRHARLIEIDPAYCDVVCERFRALTGKEVVLASTGEVFSAVAVRRAEIAEEEACDV